MSKFIDSIKSKTRKMRNQLLVSQLQDELIDELGRDISKKVQWLNLKGISKSSSDLYLRPETAQGIFLNYMNVLKTLKP